MGATDVIYLDLAQVIEIHAATMESMGQSPYPLSRPGDLESALGRPRMMAHYEGADVIQQAVRLAVSISQAQCFMEGNKRTGFESMRVFLRINGYRRLANPLDAAKWLLAVANEPGEDLRTTVERQFVDWLRASVAEADRSD